LASHRSSAAESSLPAPFSVRVSALVSVVVVVFLGEMKGNRRTLICGLAEPGLHLF
jgi:hypothetical protein